MIPEVRELCFLLTRPHMRALFDSHDQLANGEYMPQLPDVTLTPAEDNAVKIVRLVKGNEPLVGGPFQSVHRSYRFQKVTHMANLSAGACLIDL